MSGKRLKAFSLRSEERQGCLPSPLLIDMVQEVSARAKERERKLEKRKFNSLQMTQSYIYKLPQRMHQKLLELASKLSKTARYKINT
jgi:hypothetical protein